MAPVVVINGIHIGANQKIPYVIDVKSNTDFVIYESFAQELSLSVTSDSWKYPSERIGGNGYLLKFTADNPTGRLPNNYAPLFNGSSDYYTSTSYQNSSYRFGDQPFTIQANISLPEAERKNGAIVSCINRETGFTYGLSFIAGKHYQFYLTLNDNTYFSDTTELDFNTCYLVAVSRNPDGLLGFYLNGEIIGRQVYSPDIVNVSRNALLIGAKNDKSDDLFAGLIDEVKIWNVYLSGALLVSNSLANNIAGPDSNLLGSWSFEEGKYSQIAYDAGINYNDLQRGSYEEMDDNDPQMVASCDLKGLPDPQTLNSRFSAPVLNTSNELKLSVYPNPAPGSITVNACGLGDVAIMKVTAVDGRPISTDIIQVSANCINLQTGIKLSPGVYFITLISNNQSKTVKFIKQ